MEINSERNQIRNRILRAAAVLIRERGTEAATTRAVAEAASVQAPTIYRLIGDKNALLDAVAEYEIAAYVAAKREKKPHPDPVEALRHGWNKYAAFGIANPGLFLIMSGNARSPATIAGLEVLAERVHDIARAGRLRGSEERAAAMLHAACVGTVLTLLAEKENAAPTRYDLLAETREAVIAAITAAPINTESAGIEVAASTLRARLGQSNRLTKAERGLLDEFLLRLSETSTSDGG